MINHVKCDVSSRIESALQRSYKFLHRSRLSTKDKTTINNLASTHLTCNSPCAWTPLPGIHQYQQTEISPITAMEENTISRQQ